MHQVLPTGDVTFLFSDIEGSTRLLDALGTDGYAAALAAHRSAMRVAIAAHNGVEVDTQGDAFFVAFERATDAVDAAKRVTTDGHDTPIRVRIGVHTGRPLVTTEGYIGPDVHRAARIAAAGHGGQVLVSRETCDLVTGDFTDLGEHRLKDLATPTWIFQLGHDRFPPLATISNTNLPSQASTFIGRDEEIERLCSMLRGGARLMTLSGPGGSGKTRLAIETAARLVPDFKAGVFWIDLVPVDDPSVVIETIAQQIGARTDLADHIGERQMLLLLDNFEHVAAAAPELDALVEACPNLHVLVTSRERLRMRNEVDVSVPPLPPDDAVQLFAARAGVEPDATVAELCTALDNLPLAVELAAARASVMSARQMLERLGGRLDLLKQTSRADPRQQTLRATIAWSYDLLNTEEQDLLAQLSVFIGGWTLEAAEEVCGAGIDVLQSLVDKSLVRYDSERFTMLESVRSFAAEQLSKGSDATDVRNRHAGYFTDYAERQREILRSGEPEEGPVAALEAEIGNLRAAVEYGLASDDRETVRRITATMPMYWLMRGRYAEGRMWLDRALELSETHDQTRRALLSGLGHIAYAQGDHPTAVEATDAASMLATELSSERDRFTLLREQAAAAMIHDDYESAEQLFRERLALAIALDNGVATSACRINLAYIANRTGRHLLAEQLMIENLPFVRSKGQARCEANTLASLVESRLYMNTERPEDAVLGAQLAMGISDLPLALDCLDLVAASAAGQGKAVLAVTLLTATERIRSSSDVDLDEDEAAIREMAMTRMNATGHVAATSEEAGHDLDLAEAIDLALGEPSARRG